MIIITLGQGDCVRIGDDVLVALLKMRYGEAKIGVQAPKDTRIRRGEVEDKPGQDGRLPEK